MSLEKARERKKQEQFIIEGRRELLLAKAAGYQFINMFYCPDITDESELMKQGFDRQSLVPVSKGVFEKIAYRETTGGVVAVAQQKRNRLEDINLGAKPLIIVLESVEKPGNLGAVLRTADAAGVDAVISCDAETDFYNPNTVRSSLGGVFTNQIASASSEDTIAWLKKNSIRIYCTYLEASIPYTKVDFNRPCAIVMGSEAKGLSETWVKNSDSNIIIPMKGTIDSMNVSVSAAIVVFEALRQRAV
ncbi:MAG: RNA methyltransferase [Cyclobacteriaceae bacterium]|nr:RNA methyltransferase [Cyclobacteriaceae bacterium]